MLDWTHAVAALVTAGAGGWAVVQTVVTRKVRTSPERVGEWESLAAGYEKRLTRYEAEGEKAAETNEKLGARLEQVTVLYNDERAAKHKALALLTSALAQRDESVEGMRVARADVEASLHAAHHLAAWAAEVWALATEFEIKLPAMTAEAHRAVDGVPALWNELPIAVRERTEP